MIFEVFEQNGEVIKSVPSVTDLEEENFDFDCTVILVTKTSEEELKQKIMRIAEINSVTIDKLAISQNKVAQAEGTEVKHKQDTKDDKVATRTVSPNKTIRVNINQINV